jgi:hypothetical protein
LEVLGVAPRPVVLVPLLTTAAWLAAAGLLTAWQGGGTVGWVTLGAAVGAAALALWATRE